MIFFCDRLEEAERTIGKMNPFEAGYNLGHDKIAPAIFGKK